jgi:hypothetical protein
VSRPSRVTGDLGRGTPGRGTPQPRHTSCGRCRLRLDQALAVLTVDDTVPQSVLTELSEEIGATSARSVNLV